MSTLDIKLHIYSRFPTQNQATYPWLQYSNVISNYQRQQELMSTDKNSFNSTATAIFRFQSKHYWMTFGQDTGQVKKIMPSATVKVQG